MKSNPIWEKTPTWIKNIYPEFVDKLVNKKYKEIKKEGFEEEGKDKIPLFTEETTKRIIGNIENQKQIILNKENNV